MISTSSLTGSVENSLPTKISLYQTLIYFKFNLFKRDIFCYMWHPVGKRQWKDNSPAVKVVGGSIEIWAWSLLWTKRCLYVMSSAAVQWSKTYLLERKNFLEKNMWLYEIQYPNLDLLYSAPQKAWNSINDQSVYYQICCSLCQKDLSKYLIRRKGPYTN